MSRIPEGATHTHEGTYYRKSGRGAYRWKDGQWAHMEDHKVRQMLRRARPLSSHPAIEGCLGQTHNYRIAREGKSHE